MGDLWGELRGHDGPLTSDIHCDLPQGRTPHRCDSWNHRGFKLRPAPKLLTSEQDVRAFTWARPWEGKEAIATFTVTTELGFLCARCSRCQKSLRS